MLQACELHYGCDQCYKLASYITVAIQCYKLASYITVAIQCYKLTITYGCDSMLQAYDCFRFQISLRAYE